MRNKEIETMNGESGDIMVSVDEDGKVSLRFKGDTLMLTYDGVSVLDAAIAESINKRARL